MDLGGSPREEKRRWKLKPKFYSDARAENLPDHALLSASGADGWMGCLGKLWFEQFLGIQREEQDYTTEGTQIHDLAAQLILGEQVDLDQYPESIVTSAIEYSSHCKDIYRREGSYGVMCEVKLLLDRKRQMFGTLDFACLQMVNGVLECNICDLKAGVGVEVLAENNKQLMYYAAALWFYWKQEHGQDIRIFNFTIFQPNFAGKKDSPYSSWTCATPTVLEFYEELIAQADRVLEVLREERIPTFTPGKKTCQFCLVKDLCPERLEKFGVDESINQIVQLVGEGANRLKQKEFNEFTEDRRQQVEDLVAQVLPIAPRISSFIDASKKYAIMLSKKNQGISGLEVVKTIGNRTMPKPGTNKFKQLSKMLAQMEIPIYEDKVKSVSSLEKELGEPIPEALVERQEDRFKFKKAKDEKDQKVKIKVKKKGE